MTRLRRELPLVIFTALATAGAGALAMRPLAGPGPEAAALGWWGALLLATGLVVSLCHLGRPLRLFLAARGFPGSLLSVEVGLAVATLVAVDSESLLGRHGFPASAAVAQAAAALLALAFLAAMGLVYSLPGQLTWSGAAALAPSILGLASGCVALVAVGFDGPAPGRAAAVLLLGDGVVFAFRWRTLLGLRGRGEPAHPAAFERRHALLVGRLLLVTAAPTTLLLFGRLGSAAALLAAGLLWDRLVFYGLAVQHTTEAEVAAVERAMFGLL